MYIFELLLRKISQNKNTNRVQSQTKQNINENENGKCDHIFLPIDSTGKILACSKCGLLLKR